MSSANRSRIHLLPLDARHPDTVVKPPKGFTALALMWRGTVSYLAHEVLVRNDQSGQLGGWNGAVLRSVDTNKAAAALDAMMAAAPNEAAPDENAELARMLREWREKAEIPVSRAAQMLGIPARTIEGIEQGRGFRYARLLALALLAFE